MASPDRDPAREPAGPDGSTGLADRDQIERGLLRLNEAQRTILVLNFYVGLSPTEMADALEIPVGTAKSRLHYAIEALRAHWPPTSAPGRRRTGGPHGMSANYDLERRIADHYAAEAPLRAPDWVLEPGPRLHRHHPTAADRTWLAVEDPEHAFVSPSSARPLRPPSPWPLFRCSLIDLRRSRRVPVADGLTLAGDAATAVDRALRLDAPRDLDGLPRGLADETGDRSPGPKVDRISTRQAVDVIFDPRSGKTCTSSSPSFGPMVRSRTGSALRRGRISALRAEAGATAWRLLQARRRAGLCFDLGCGRGGGSRHTPGPRRRRAATSSTSTSWTIGCRPTTGTGSRRCSRPSTCARRVDAP